MTTRRGFWAACSALGLAGCAAGPDFRAPQANLPRTWAEAHGAAVAASPARLTEWWTGFGDPELSSLVARACAANLDARAAVLRIAEARARAGAAVAGAWPEVSVGGSAERQRISERTAITSLLAAESHGSAPAAGLPGAVAGFPNPFNQVQAGLDASWEIDVFGRVRRSIEAAHADTEAEIEDARAALAALAAETAADYLRLRGAQAQAAVLRRSAATEREALALTRERARAAIGNELDVEEAAAQVAATEARLPPARQAVELEMSRLDLLLALPPGTLRGELSNARPLPPAPPLVPIGLPSDLARQRPDIREAEARLHAATARLGVAVADLYPSVILTGSAGFSAERAADLSDWAARYAAVGPSIDLPVFDAGERRATVRVADIRAQEAAVAYARTVLQALGEVENALLAYRSDAARRVALAAEADRAREVLALSRQRYSSGVTAYFEVLDAERRCEAAELELAAATTAVSTDVVTLCQALGGSWD